MTTAEEPIPWSDRAVKHALPVHSTRATRYMETSEELVTSLGEVALVLQAAGNEADVSKLKEYARKILEARHEIDLHQKAVNTLTHTYHATGEATNFEQLLKARTEAVAPLQPYNVESDELYKNFLTCLEEEQEAQEEQIDDDIAIAGGGTSLAPNEACPITAKTLLNLDEPVQDAKGVVYEKAAIVEFLRRKSPPGSSKCPMAGTTHVVSVHELVPANKVLAAKKRAQRGRGRATQAEVDEGDVVDVE